MVADTHQGQRGAGVGDQLTTFRWEHAGPVSFSCAADACSRSVAPRDARPPDTDSLRSGVDGESAGLMRCARFAPRTLRPPAHLPTSFVVLFR